MPTNLEVPPVIVSLVRGWWRQHGQQAPTPFFIETFLVFTVLQMAVFLQHSSKYDWDNTLFVLAWNRNAVSGY